MQWSTMSAQSHWSCQMRRGENNDDETTPSSYSHDGSCTMMCSMCRALIVGLFGDRAFAAGGPTLWNSLPHDITDCVLLTSFCRKRKTFLFSISFPWLHFTFFAPWGFYLSHFKISYACVCMYACSLWYCDSTTVQPWFVCHLSKDSSNTSTVGLPRFLRQSKLEQWRLQNHSCRPMVFCVTRIFIQSTSPIYDWAIGGWVSE